MSLLDILSDHEVWEKFYKYKTSLIGSEKYNAKLRAFIDEKRYIRVCENVYSGASFPLPKKSVISKTGSEKKRVVYTYPEDENTVLKLLTYLILRKYDGIFSPGLYSFRPDRTAKDAVRRLLKIKEVPRMYSYKADIHNYFNSIPVELLLPELKKTLFDDPPLYEFLSSLLSEKNVIDRGRTVSEQKGIMAGTPVSSFYANLFLSDLDRHFTDGGVIYERYSDDIILFAESREKAEEHAQYIKEYINARGLSINPSKESRTGPGQPYTFLGFICGGDKVDIAPATLKKLKQKMRRKRDALVRWSTRNGVEPVKAAKAFIRIFNRKLLEAPTDNELSWSGWFFPVINTAESLHEIDLYSQDCLRYIISGVHTKSRYNVRYGDLKALGYRSLLNAYYAHTENEAGRKKY